MKIGGRGAEWRSNHHSGSSQRHVLRFGSDFGVLWGCLLESLPIACIGLVYHLLSRQKALQSVVVAANGAQIIDLLCVCSSATSVVLSPLSPSAVMHLLLLWCSESLGAPEKSQNQEWTFPRFSRLPYKITDCTSVVYLISTCVSLPWGLHEVPVVFVFQPSMAPSMLMLKAHFCFKNTARSSSKP